MQYHKLADTILASVYQYLSGNMYHTYLKQLRKTQFWNLNRLEKLQRFRLRRILHHAYDCSPYYRRTFKALDITPSDIRDISHIARLPILTKELIRENLNDLRARYTNPSKEYFLATGGSTGEPMHFYVSRESAEYAEATRLRGWEYTGYRFGDKYVKLWATSYDVSHYYKPISRIRRIVHRDLLIDTNVITSDDIAQKIEQIRIYRPYLIMGYTSMLYRIAEYIIKNDIEFLNVPAIVTGAETLYPHWRKPIESAFGGSLYNHYQTRETCVSSDECKSHEGSHVSVEVGQIEILKDDEPVFDEMGRVLVTDYFNFAMPLIRYDLQDVASISSSICSCGRVHPLIKDIQGRVNDFIIGPSGKVYNPILFMWMIYQDPYNAVRIVGIEDYQVVQDKIDHLIVNFVVTPDMTASLMNRIRQNFKDGTSNEFEIDFRIVDRIPLTPAGKRRYVISMVESPW